MALKKKDKKEEVTETAVTAEDVLALAETETGETFNADTERLQRAVHIVSKTFNLDGYEVRGFTDSLNKMKLVMENEDFKVAVEMKKTANFGLCPDN